jgi:predicted nucleic acid-binding protein
MTAVLIDANVLLDVMTEDPRWLAWSAEAIARAADRHRLVIDPVIYAEVSIRYSRIEELDAALPKAMVNREAIPHEAAFLAGKSFLTYRRQGGMKQSPLPDFFIGAHAAVARYPLMTRNPARYPTYYPKLTLIAQAEHAGKRGFGGEKVPPSSSAATDHVQAACPVLPRPRFAECLGRPYDSERRVGFRVFRSPAPLLV